MARRRFILLTPVLPALGAVLVLTVEAPPPGADGSALTFTFGGDETTTAIDRAVIRRRTITPEFDPPLDLVLGRVVYARRSLACASPTLSAT